MAEITLTRAQSRAVDAAAIERCGFSGMVLMENAGRGVVELLLDWDPALAEAGAAPIAILCGKGNNAGDGFVIARHLEIRGACPRVFLLFPSEELRGDALQNYEILRHTNVPIVDLSKTDDLQAQLQSQTADAAWIVDAMLGTGAHGEPREPIRSAITWMNQHKGKRLAIDVPSGLDCDTGQPAECCVRADHTCTFVAPKIGFATAGNILGQLHVVSIGIPPRLIEEVIKS